MSKENRIYVDIPDPGRAAFDLLLSQGLFRDERTGRSCATYDSVPKRLGRMIVWYRSGPPPALPAGRRMIGSWRNVYRHREMNGLLDPSPHVQPKLMRRALSAVGYTSDSRPPVKTELEEPMNWQPWAALSAAAAASAALYYFFG